MPYFENLRKYIVILAQITRKWCRLPRRLLVCFDGGRVPDSCLATRAQICLEAAVPPPVSCLFPPLPYRGFGCHPNIPSLGGLG